MADLARFVLVLLFLTVLILVQGTRFFSFNGINPNLVFVFFSGLILTPNFQNRIKPKFLAILLFFTFILEFFFSSFWLVPWLILMLMIIAVCLLKGFFTGQPFIDFLLVLGLGTPLFYGLLKFASGTIFKGGVVLWETLYNLIFGIVFWFCFNLFKKYAR